MAEKSKILIIGGTGYIGKFIVEASAKSGHPTFVLLREKTISDPAKSNIIDGFKNSGINILQGDLNDKESLVKAIKQVDVVISTVGQMQLADQLNIIAAIKEAGNIKRFFPSEFGNDVDRARAVEPAKSAWAVKVEIRRAIEAEGIPYTFVTSNFFAGYSLPSLMQPGPPPPPRDKVIILGDGNAKAVFNNERDIGTYTIRAVDDPRTLNKILYIKPSKNIYSFNEVVNIWEKKIGKTLEKIYVPEDQVLKQIAGDGNAKAVFNFEGDIGTYTIKAVDDPRTLNKIVYIKPPKNIYSFNELVALWEKKIGKTLEKEYVTEEQLLKQIQESPVPLNIILSVNHSIFVKGDQTYFEIEPSFGVEASELYPDVKYTTVEEYLDQFV
ncbi:hypothetical protein RD792_000985 [Penstemon davidsonii]|uniref:NmrA-like domain-containing protein n=1 Tax=Penstemon davidsonii TaxID=160366 RepID=A0ABR0DNC3_9LAMI|nr:hypothetical protein RD792_000985 [Penstemon davidsonii]